MGRSPASSYVDFIEEERRGEEREDRRCSHTSKKSLFFWNAELLGAGVPSSNESPARNK
jgi:hypothetical protein